MVSLKEAYIKAKNDYVKMKDPGESVALLSCRDAGHHWFFHFTPKWYAALWNNPNVPPRVIPPDLGYAGHTVDKKTGVIGGLGSGGDRSILKNSTPIDVKQFDNL